ncbi:hypothetical protein ACFLZZ_03405 [Nanoarchaeota archaeon]
MAYSKLKKLALTGLLALLPNTISAEESKEIMGIPTDHGIYQVELKRSLTPLESEICIENVKAGRGCFDNKVYKQERRITPKAPKPKPAPIKNKTKPKQKKSQKEGFLKRLGVSISGGYEISTRNPLKAHYSGLNDKLKNGEYTSNTALSPWQSLSIKSPNLKMPKIELSKNFNLFNLTETKPFDLILGYKQTEQSVSYSEDYYPGSIRLPITRTEDFKIHIPYVGIKWTSKPKINEKFRFHIKAFLEKWFVKGNAHTFWKNTVVPKEPITHYNVSYNFDNFHVPTVSGGIDYNVWGPFHLSGSMGGSWGKKQTKFGEIKTISNDDTFSETNPLEYTFNADAVRGDISLSARF